MSGVDAMKMAVSSQMSDKNEHNNLLRETLKNLPDRRLDKETGESFYMTSHHVTISRLFKATQS